MNPKNNHDAAFSHLLHNVLDSTNHAAELAQEVVNDGDEQLLALQRRFSAQPAKGFLPGQLVRWKAGMKNRSMPTYGEPAIVMEVLNPPVFNHDPDADGSNLFREPLSLVLGIQHKSGDFLTFHFDGRRFEVMADAGDTP